MQFLLYSSSYFTVFLKIGRLDFFKASDSISELLTTIVQYLLSIFGFPDGWGAWVTRLEPLDYLFQNTPN